MMVVSMVVRMAELTAELMAELKVVSMAEQKAELMVVSMAAWMAACPHASALISRARGPSPEVAPRGSSAGGPRP